VRDCGGKGRRYISQNPKSNFWKRLYLGLCGDCAPPPVRLKQDDHQEDQQAHAEQGEAVYQGPSPAVCRGHKQRHAGRNLGRWRFGLPLHASIELLLPFGRLRGDEVGVFDSKSGLSLLCFVVLSASIVLYLLCGKLHFGQHSVEIEVIIAPSLSSVTAG